MRIPAYFSAAYAPDEVPLLARLGTTRDRLQRLGLVDLHEAAPLDPAALDGLHDAAYLQAFLAGIEPMASRQGIRWSPRVRDATLAMLGGQLQAAQHAIERGGIAMNIARGFHHAHPAAGSGFCPVNGLALLAHAMPGRRILVIDCDEHGGNGTEEFAARLPNLHAVSIFGTRFGCRGGVRSWAHHITREQGFPAYLDALRQAASLVLQVTPDLLVYQAGADCHRDDPKSQLRLSTTEMFQRDLAVFRLARRRRIPLLFVVAGGYQSADRVAYLNSNTVRAARHAWQEPIAP
ncbi:hypothetical protein LDO26_07340 [Luteimonas sp. BDR2-5]|uniref:hypothetical protein n=1 Tax=Proluteimonas luteida TaxID=2878685 RepID=UPI001E32CBE9|nr:hypothetical protein [Luteimonas sp. BDR2-5]MCD9028020.1 hypothetical protein [Luteimonas sp. BDR2-5]